jgi:small neutral amino acid transporter SnatA (MarC family)
MLPKGREPQFLQIYRSFTRQSKKKISIKYVILNVGLILQVLSSFWMNVYKVATKIEAKIKR